MGSNTIINKPTPSHVYKLAYIMKKIDLTRYIKNEPIKTIPQQTKEDRKKQATLYLGIVSCGQLMLDYMDSLNEMNRKRGYKPNEMMQKGMDNTELFVTEMVKVFGDVVDISSNLSFSDLQNKLDYQIKKQIKYVAEHAK